MKKNIIFLMTLITILIVHSNVKAASTNFYEAEKIDSIYTKSIKNGTTHFQKSRFFRRKSDNKAAYCIEPFNFFDESASYETSINPNNIEYLTPIILIATVTKIPTTTASINCPLINLKNI